MSVRPIITSRMIEFHRYGEEEESYSRSRKYIRTAGWGEPATDVSPTFTYDQFLDHLSLLRYESATPAEVEQARQALADEAARLLPTTPATADELLQIDLVSNAAELWAFPFESAFIRNNWLQSPTAGVVLTRRIRNSFSDSTVPWPAAPVVLFAHAPVADDLSKELIDRHRQALGDALAPWSRGKSPIEAGRLVECEVFSSQDLERERAKRPFGYVHLLAHGALLPQARSRPDRLVWGLRLGYAGEPGTAPELIAKALSPAAGLPLVVTLAACDSANQGQPVFATRSVVQDLHRAGVPVVVGSQLPLTQEGSVALTRAFYGCLLMGADVRAALHAGRVALFEDPKAGHDWLSLVAYARLPPEGYAQHLRDFGVRAEQGLLRAAQARAEDLNRNGGTLDAFAEVESLLRLRMASLAERCASLSKERELLDECIGLRASAFKHLAELLFTRASRHGTAKDRPASERALAESADHYRAAFRTNVNNHWLGMQHLALEAAISGRFERPSELALVEYVANLAAEANPGDYWSLGTLAEAHLLAPLAARPHSLEAAVTAARGMASRARQANDTDAIESTRRQFGRYVTWWTTANGFFRGRPDLSADAAQILEVLD